MRGGARLGLRLATPLAFAATAVLAVIVSRVPAHSALALQDGPGPQRVVATARCATSELRISMGTGTRVASMVTRYALDFTNVSGTPCTLAGYPEVAAYRGDGVQVGELAAHDTSVAASRVLLAPGETAHAALDTSLSAKTKCHPVRAAGLRVGIASGQSPVRYVKRPLTACAGRAAAGQNYLRVHAIQRGATIRSE